MKKQIACILCCSSLLLPFSLPRSIGCSGIDEPDVTESLLFNPKIINQEKLEPLFLTYHGYFEQNDWERSSNSNGVNRLEWSAHLRDKFTPEELDWLLYKATAKDVESLRKGKQNPDTNDSLYTSLLLSKFKLLPSAANDLKYLSHAKTAEELSVIRYYSWHETKTDTLAILHLLQDLQHEMNTEKDPFLQGRYGYQLLKTYHYLGYYDEGIQLYESKLHADRLFSESIRWRNKGYYAACLYKRERYTSSNLLYADIFRNYEPQRLDAYNSFHPQEEKDWNELLLLSTPEQRKTLWLFYGLYNDPVKGMEEIFKEDPLDKEMEVLLMRAVNIAEYNRLSNPVYGWSEEHYFEQDPGLYKGSTLRSWRSVNEEQLLHLISAIDLRLKVTTAGTQPWLSAKAFLLYLKKDFAAAKKTLETSLLKSESDLRSQQQNTITSALIFAETMQVNDPSQEEMMAELLLTMKKDATPKFEPAERYVLRILAKQYEKTGNEVKRMLCSRTAERDLDTQSNVTAVREFMERKDLNTFERYLCDHYTYTLADIYDMEGTGFMYQYDWVNANAAFSRHPDAGSLSTYGDPFLIHTIDCHDCDHQLANSIKYTKRTFTLKMLELSRKIKSEKVKQKKSELCFQYANGLYNMTWYGNARVLSSTNLHYSEDDYYLTAEEIENRPYFSCREAGKWYEEARALSTNMEFGAKCAWMAAKCEHNEWLNTLSVDENMAFRAGDYFNLLKTRYSTTSYYREILNECGYFCKFHFGSMEKCREK